MISVEDMFNRAYKAACESLDESVKEIFEDSTEHYCPVDKGVMKASAKNELIVDTEEEHAREISYNTKYAIYVHEIIRYHHGNKSAKFLEIPINYNHTKLITNAKKAFGDALGR